MCIQVKSTIIALQYWDLEIRWINITEIIICLLFRRKTH